MEPIRINNGEAPVAVDQEALAAALAASNIDPELLQTAATQQTNFRVPGMDYGDNDGSSSTGEEIDDTPVDKPAPIAEPVPQEEPVKATEPVAEDVVIPRKKQNVTITEEITRETTWNPEADTLTLPSNFNDETRAVLEKVPNINLVDNAHSRDWLQAVSEGTETVTFKDTFVKTLEEDSADFFQFVEQNGAKLAGAQPKFKALENQTLTGERAAIRLMSHLGLGTLFQVPLWHTGIWITFKAPSDSDIIELNRRMIADKIQMGRLSYGLAFSNTGSYTTDRLVDFALSYVYDASVSSTEIPTAELKNWIDCQDIPSLLWGFICTMYPKGFQYRRACTNDPEKCNHIAEELLNVTKLQWINRSALTEWQRNHMSSRRSNSKDKASIIRYKEEMAKTQKRRITFNKDEPSEISMTLKTPSIAAYVDAGHRWISSLVELVDDALGQDARDQERNNYVMRHAQASSMRQYVHWVESIEMDSNIINDMESIEKSFNMLSSHGEIRNTFVEDVVNYINDSTVAVIGIPVFDCPVCKTPQEEDMKMKNHKNIIPLDVIQVFFDLLTQRLSKINER